MRAAPSAWGAGVESGVAVLASVSVGVGALLLFIGGAGQLLEMAVAGGVLFGSGVLLLLVGEWIDWLPLLVVSLPLPALYSSDALRVAPAAVASAVVVVAWFLARAPRPFRLSAGSLPTRSLAALVGAVLLSTAFAQHTGPAVRELANWVILLALLVALVHHLGVDPSVRSRRLALAIAAVIGLSGACAVTQSFGLLPGRFPMTGTALMRATLGFGWPNELGTFFAMGIPFSVYAVQTAERPSIRWIAIAGLTAAVLGLLCTFSRGSWLATVGATPSLLLLGERKTLAWVWVVLACLVGVLDATTGGALSTRISGVVDDPYVIQRMGLMLAGVLMFLANPVVGVGPGGYVEALDRYGPRVTWLWDYVGSSHNAYIEVAAEMGAVGLIAFVAFLLITFRALLGAARAPVHQRDERLLRRAVLWSFATTCLVSFTIWPLAHGLGQLLVSVLALGFASTRASTAGEAPRP